jgi:hypothetical protein
MHAFRHSRLRPWLLGLAAAALVWVQLLGVLHGVAHAPGAVALHGASVPSALAERADTLGGLFAGHDRDQHCQLFDQLAHADLASAATPDLPVAAFAAVLQAAEPASCQAARSRGFRARDPPVLA